MATMGAKKLLRAAANKRAVLLLHKVGQRDKAGAPVQQPRVAIARAPAMEPDIMLFDKPT